LRLSYSVKRFNTFSQIIDHYTASFPSNIEFSAKKAEFPWLCFSCKKDLFVGYFTLLKKPDGNRYCKECFANKTAQNKKKKAQVENAHPQSHL